MPECDVRLIQRATFYRHSGQGGFSEGWAGAVQIQNVDRDSTTRKNAGRMLRKQN
jgi:hypothetical protein